MLHCREWLSRHAEQFRAIQKRLLTRFKDKTPVGLANLDTLLDGTYMQVKHQQCYKFTLDYTICINKLVHKTSLYGKYYQFFLYNIV